MYLQNFKVLKLTEPELQSIFYDYSEQEITFVKLLFVTSTCGISEWFIYILVENKLDFEAFKNNKILW